MLNSSRVAAAPFKSPRGEIRSPAPDRMKGRESPCSLSENLGPVAQLSGAENGRTKPPAATYFSSLGQAGTVCRQAPSSSPQGQLSLYLDSSAGWEAHPCTKSFLSCRPLALSCCREKAGKLVSILTLQLVGLSEPQFSPLGMVLGYPTPFPDCSENGSELLGKTRHSWLGLEPGLRTTFTGSHSSLDCSQPYPTLTSQGLTRE